VDESSGAAGPGSAIPPATPPAPETAPAAETPSAHAAAVGARDRLPSEPEAAGATAPSLQHTAVRCFALVARHHGADVSAERLIHDYSLEEQEPSVRRLLRIASDYGFKTKHTRLRWQQLRRLGQGFPVIARLTNGNFVILVGMKVIEQEDGSSLEQVVLFDPLADRSEFISLGRADFEKAWKGEVILAKRLMSMLDPNQPFSLKWFIPEIARQGVSFTDVAIAVLFMHLIALVVPLYFQIVIDKVLVNYAQATLQVITVGIGVALLFEAILSFLRGYILLHASSKIDVRVSTRTFQHMINLPMDFFEKISAGVLTKHMQQSSTIRQFLTGSLFVTLLEATALFVFIPILWFYSPALLMVVLLFSGLMALTIGLLLGPYRRRLEALYIAEGERQAMLVESIHGAQTIKALSMEPVQRKKWDDRTAQSVAMHFRVGKISTLATSLSKLLEKCMTVGIVWYGANLVFSEQLSVGALVAFQMIAGRVSGPLVQLVSLVHSYQETALSIRMLGQVMNRPTEAGVGHGLRPELAGRIEFENVHFQYTPEAPPALQGVSFVIPQGSVIGVVGRSGSGKTTLTRLIQGMYPIRQGLIRIDGLDLRELDIGHLRQNIGVVLQDNFLFKGTIRQNIAMAKSNATFQEVVYSAKLAGADEFIERLPQSYDTVIEENGSNLSGGQKQRLAIARAMLTDPKILIFDEATSALDPESEAIVQKNLARMARGRTVILVSHRLSMLTGCDSIIVLDEGRVDAIGSHRQILETSKVYRELWHQQTGHR
jgi:ATP-binding cassette subfamily B protein